MNRSPMLTDPSRAAAAQNVQIKPPMTQGGGNGYTPE